MRTSESRRPASPGDGAHDLAQPGLVLDSVAIDLDGTRIVDGVSAVLPRGTVTGVIGPNGTGKSTLLRGIAGVVPVSGGAVRWSGDDLLRLSVRQRARRLAFVEQNAHTAEPLTVREVVELGRLPHQPVFRFGGADAGDAEAVDRALETAGCADLAHRRFTTLSGGQRQRVGLARALAQDPAILLLDEPTNHLDPQAQLRILDLVRELADAGLTIVTALHDLTHAASVCDQVLVLADGRLRATGDPEAVLTRETIRAVYDVDADMLRHPRTGAPVFALSLPEDRDLPEERSLPEDAGEPQPRRSAGSTSSPNATMALRGSAAT